MFSGRGENQSNRGSPPIPQRDSTHEEKLNEDSPNFLSRVFADVLQQVTSESVVSSVDDIPTAVEIPDVIFASPVPSLKSPTRSGKQFYSIVNGKDGFCGIVESWQEAELLIMGLPKRNGCKHAGHHTHSQAEAWMVNQMPSWNRDKDFNYDLACQQVEPILNIPYVDRSHIIIRQSEVLRCSPVDTTDITTVGRELACSNNLHAGTVIGQFNGNIIDEQQKDAYVGTPYEPYILEFGDNQYLSCYDHAMSDPVRCYCSMSNSAIGLYNRLTDYNLTVNDNNAKGLYIDDPDNPRIILYALRYIPAYQPIMWDYFSEEYSVLSNQSSVFVGTPPTTANAVQRAYYSSINDIAANAINRLNQDADPDLAFNNTSADTTSHPSLPGLTSDTEDDSTTEEPVFTHPQNSDTVEPTTAVLQVESMGDDDFAQRHNRAFIDHRTFNQNVLSVTTPRSYPEDYVRTSPVHNEAQQDALRYFRSNVRNNGNLTPQRRSNQQTITTYLSTLLPEIIDLTLNSDTDADSTSSSSVAEEG